MSLKSVKLPLKSAVLATLLLTFTVTAAAESLTAEQRLVRLENMLSSQVLMEQSQRLEQIQQELANLRGMVEAQDNQLNLIKQRQRNLYQDMDRRLNDLEITGGAGIGADKSDASSIAMPVAGGSSIAPPGAAITTDVAASDSSSMTSMVVPGDKNGKSAYTQAFNTLKEGRYQDAIQAFRAFQKNYPESPYAANAQYWLGETYSVSREYKTALQEFQSVVKQYPESNKVEGAMLKIGYTYYEMQDWAAAKTALEQVMTKFPGTSVARKAQERLERIKREGH